MHRNTLSRTLTELDMDSHEQIKNGLKPSCRGLFDRCASGMQIVSRTHARPRTFAGLRRLSFQCQWTRRSRCCAFAVPSSLQLSGRRGDDVSWHRISRPVSLRFRRGVSAAIPIVRQTALRVQLLGAEQKSPARKAGSRCG